LADFAPLGLADLPAAGLVDFVDVVDVLDVVDIVVEYLVLRQHE
jgi:hypothetical protein